jgi:hypothetical protein
LIIRLHYIPDRFAGVEDSTRLITGRYDELFDTPLRLAAAVLLRKERIDEGFIEPLTPLYEELGVLAELNAEIVGKVGVPRPRCV